MQERFDLNLSVIQEELEKSSSREKAELIDQIKHLRHDYLASISSVDENSESIKKLEPYTRMESIAHTPSSSTPPLSSTPDLSKRVVIGQEREAEVCSPIQLAADACHINISEEESDTQTGYIEVSCVGEGVELSYLDESLQRKVLLTEQVHSVSQATMTK